MHVTELTCPDCKTQIRGTFAATKLDCLNREQLEFVEVFLRCKGSIKEVERELKISYPTVRSRLEQIITNMGYSPAPEDANETFTDQSNVIDAFANGEMTFEETLEKLKGARSK